MADEWLATEAGALCLAIARSKVVAPTVDRLARRMGLEPDDLEARIVAAYDAGDVEPWHKGGKDRVTLTPRTAARLGVKIPPDGKRWARAGCPEPAPRVAVRSWLEPAGDDEVARYLNTAADVPDGSDEGIGIGVDGEDDAPTPFPESVADDAPGPVQAAIATEELLRKVGERERPSAGWAPPFPTVLLGQRLLWPVARARGEACPSCRDRCRPWEYCLWCDRFGLEHLLGRAKPLQTDAEAKAQAARAKRRVAGTFGKWAAPAPVARAAARKRA